MQCYFSIHIIPLAQGAGFVGDGLGCRDEELVGVDLNSLSRGRHLLLAEIPGYGILILVFVPLESPCHSEWTPICYAQEGEKTPLAIYVPREIHKRRRQKYRC